MTAPRVWSKRFTWIGLFLLAALAVNGLFWGVKDALRSTLQPDLVEVHDSWRVFGDENGRFYKVFSREHIGIYMNIDCVRSVDGNEASTNYSVRLHTLVDRRVFPKVEPSTVVRVAGEPSPVLLAHLLTPENSSEAQLMGPRYAIRLVRRLVEEGFLEVTAGGKTVWFFADASLSRISPANVC